MKRMIQITLIVLAFGMIQGIAFFLLFVDARQREAALLEEVRSLHERQAMLMKRLTSLERVEEASSPPLSPPTVRNSQQGEGLQSPDRSLSPEEKQSLQEIDRTLKDLSERSREQKERLKELLDKLKNQLEPGDLNPPRIERKPDK